MGIMADFNITEDEYHEFKSAFDMFDTDHSGDISADELQAILSQLGKPATLEEAQTMIRNMDENGDGEIDFREFIIMMKKDSQPEDELRNAFDVFDADGNGFIDRDELKVVMTQLIGKGLTDEELDAMMKEADTDKNGQIDFEEFKAMMGH